MKNHRPVILIKCGKPVQNYIKDYFVDYNDALIFYIDSAAEIDKIEYTQEIALLIVEINANNKIPLKVIANYKKKTNNPDVPILYLTQKSFESLNFKSNTKSGYFDILQLPFNKEIFISKIKLFIHNHTLQRKTDYIIQNVSKSTADEGGKNNLERQFSERTEQYTKKITEPIRTKSTFKEKDQRMDNTSRFLEMLIEGIPIPIFIKNHKGEYIKCNREFENFIERPRGKIFGKKIFDITSYKIADRINRNDMKILQTGENTTYEEIFRKSDGSVVNIIINKNVFYNEQNNSPGIIGTVFDITEIRRAEKLLKIQHTIDYLASLKKGLSLTLKNILDQILELEWADGGGIYIYNKEKEELKLTCSSGVSEQFIKSARLYKKESPQLKLVLKKKPIYESYNKLANKNKTRIRDGSFNLVAIIPLVNQENNELIGCLNLISRKHNKITEQEKSDVEFIVQSLVSLIIYAQSQEKNEKLNRQLKKTLKEQQTRQQYLIQKSKLESLGELSAGIAHEINQPLGVVTLSLENLQMKIASRLATPDYLLNKFNSIEDNIGKIRQIIDHIRSFSRDQDLFAIEKVNLNNVVKKALSLIGTQYRNHNIHIKLYLNEEIGFTVGSNVKIEQVILNLLSNAKYAVDEKATYMNEMEYKKEIIIRTNTSDKKVSLEIEDNGIGIDVKDMSKIFDPFYTTKPEGFGTGVGLSIAYGIIRSMRGDIRVESKKNNYTKFEIFLPRFPENN